MLRTRRIRGVCGRECVGETTLIPAFQPVLLGILVTIAHQANATVIEFVRLYSRKAKRYLNLLSVYSTCRQDLKKTVSSILIQMLFNSRL